MINLETEQKARLDREAKFHDIAYGDESLRDSASKHYVITETSLAQYRSLIFDSVEGKRVLEYGCGINSDGVELARLGGRVVGIDISEVAIQTSIDSISKFDQADRIEYRVMNAEQLEFEENSFDLVCGIGILHHLDLVRAYSELSRVLVPGGKAIFREPMGHNYLINKFRDRTPDLRTQDEHPLLMSDLELADNYFSDVTIHFCHLASLGVVPLRKTRLFLPAYRLAERFDKFLFRKFPKTRSWAWIAILEMKN